MKIVKLIILFVGMWLVTSCQTNSVDLASATHKGYIAEVQGNRILVGDIYFGVKEAKVLTDNDKRRESSILEVGMNVEIEFDGVVAESFPAQARADKVIIMTDPDSKRAEEAVKAIVDEVERKFGKPVIIRQAELADDQFSAELVYLSGGEPVLVRFDFESKKVMGLD